MFVADCSMEKPVARVSDRNLLFGILALQMDFITRDALVDAMQAWLFNKQKLLGELLVERGALAATDRQLLEPLVDAHIRKHGGAEQSLAALSSDDGVGAKLKDLNDPDLQASLLAVPEPVREVGTRSSAYGNQESETGVEAPVKVLGQPLVNRSGLARELGPDEHDQHLEAETNFQATLEQTEEPTTRFRILRPHAEGGLGRVSVAKDHELNREVAFKEIKLKHARDANARSRFVVEAEVTGSLEHPGIVPVYGLGNFADGRPFYAMRFIKGDSLQEASEAFHKSGSSLPYDQDLLFRNLIKRLIDVCNAIAYAHARKVLHRDLKPGNIMLGKYGETLVVDWGLAKAQGAAEPAARSTDGELPIVPTSGSQSAPTLAGAVLGTAAYMPPEQAAGHLEQLGPACDIYSLGATLYHVLTGQAPLKSVPIAELLKRVIAGDVPSPRSLNQRVPAALNAVCQKAMSRAIKDRYATAAELAQDLEAWLADKPVMAFPEPWIVRARRWNRQHPAVVASLSAAVLMAAVGWSIGFFVVSGKNSELDQKNLALNTALANEQSALQTARDNEASATAAKRLAETNSKAAAEQSELALSTLGGIIFDVNGSLDNVAGGAEVRRVLMTRVLPQLDKVSTQFAQKSAVDRNTMFALINLADTFVELGQSRPHPPRENGRVRDDNSDVQSIDPTAQSAVVAAERLYRRAHEIARQRTEADPNDAQHQRDLSISFNKLGGVLLKLGRTDDALTQFQHAMKIRRVLAEADPNDFQKQRDLSISFNRLGDLFLKLSLTDDALAQFQNALKISRVLAEADPNNSQNQRNLSIAFERLGDVFLKLGRTDDALTQFQHAMKIRRVLAEADLNDAQNQRDLSIAFNRLGDVFLTLGRTEDALAQFEADLKISRMLAEADPNNAQNQRDLSISFERLGGVFLKLGRTDDALTRFQHGFEIRRVLAEADPKSAEKQQDLMFSHHKLGEVEVEAGRFGTAREHFQAGVAVLDRMIANGQNVAASKEFKTFLEGRIQLCKNASLATGDWQTLLTVDAKELPVLLSHRAAEFSKRGQLADVAQAGAKLRELSATAEAGNAYSQKAGILYGAACAYGLCVTLSETTNPQPTESELAERKMFIDLALACLKDAVDAGFDNFNHMQKDDDLKSLRDLPDFITLSRSKVAKSGTYPPDTQN